MKKVVLNKTQANEPIDLLKTVMVQPPPNRGIPPDEMRGRIKVLDALELSKGGEVFLEDADLETLRVAYKAFQWPFAHKDILAVLDALEAAEDVKPKLEEVIKE